MVCVFHRMARLPPLEISFNNEEFKIRHFFFTKTYKRENVIAIEEPREHREGARSLTPF